MRTSEECSLKGGAGRVGKVAISLRLNGVVVGQIELSPLEYEVIRTAPLSVAVRELIKKAPVLCAQEEVVHEILRNMATGSFMITDNGNIRKEQENEPERGSR